MNSCTQKSKFWFAFISDVKEFVSSIGFVTDFHNSELPLLKISIFVLPFKSLNHEKKIKGDKSYITEHDEVVIAILFKTAGLERSGMRAELFRSVCLKPMKLQI